MTTPTARDLERAQLVCAAAWNQCRQDNTQYDDELVKSFSACLAAERASLPESVMKRLQDAVTYINQVPMDSDANLDNAEFEITEAMGEIEAWIKDGGG